MMARLGRKAALAALWSAIRASHRGGPGLGQRLGAVPRMLWYALTGRYDGRLRVVLMTAAMIYIVSPIDFVPEALLGPLGLIDDAGIAVWLAGAVLSETERFLEWEGRRVRPVSRKMAAR